MTQRGVSARVWLGCRMCVYMYLVDGAVCLSMMCGMCLPGAVPMADWVGEEVLSSLSPKLS